MPDAASFGLFKRARKLSPEVGVCGGDRQWVARELRAAGEIIHKGLSVELDLLLGDEDGSVPDSWRAAVEVATVEPDHHRPSLGRSIACTHKLSIVTDQPSGVGGATRAERKKADRSNALRRLLPAASRSFRASRLRRTVGNFSTFRDKIPPIYKLFGKINNIQHNPCVIPKNISSTLTITIVCLYNVYMGGSLQDRPRKEWIFFKLGE